MHDFLRKKQREILEEYWEESLKPSGYDLDDLCLSISVCVDVLQGYVV